MTTQQMQMVLFGAAMSMLGAPALVLHAFFYRPERLITPKRLRVMLHLLGASALVVLSGLFIHYFLPGWGWVQWVNLAVYVLALVASWRRLGVWYICAYSTNNEWGMASLGTVMQTVFDRFGYGLTISRVGAVHMKLTVASIPEVVRTFKPIELEPDEILTQMVAVFNGIPGTEVIRQDHGEIHSISTTRLTRGTVRVVVA